LTRNWSKNLQMKFLKSIIQFHASVLTNWIVKKKRKITRRERKGRKTLSDTRIKGFDACVTAGAILRCREALRKLPYGGDEIDVGSTRQRSAY